jgi:hypothetical protein
MVMTMGMTWARKWLWLDFSRHVSSEAALGYDFCVFFTTIIKDHKKKHIQVLEYWNIP